MGRGRDVEAGNSGDRSKNLGDGGDEKAQQSKACGADAAKFIDRASQALPRHLWILLLFVALIGLFMTWTIPSFQYYRNAGNAALSGQWQGWLGCTRANTTATPNSTQNPIVLSRYKGIQGSLNSDLGETPLLVGLEPRLQPQCPATDAQGNPVNPDEPFIKVVFTLSTITPEAAQAMMDVTVQAVNALDLTAPAAQASLLNVTGGVVTVGATPAFDQVLTLQWLEQTRTFAGVRVQLNTEAPITDYPWDQYSIERLLSAEVLLYNATSLPEVRPIPVQVWTQITTQQYSAWVVNENNQTTKDVKGVLYLSNTLPLTIRITRSAFTKSYAVVLVIFLWLIGGLNLMHCLDSVFVRPRDLADAFAPALLFALPSFRNTMPGIPPVVGVAVDMIGLIWAELMVAICVLISFIAFLGQYHHEAPFFRRVIKADKKD